MSLLAGSFLVTVATAPAARAYGTIPGREHSNITRAALGCPQSGTDRDFMQYVNCGSTAQALAPFAVGAGSESQYTLARVCRTVQPGAGTSWVIDPSYFPPENTNLQTVTHCWPGAAARSQTIAPKAAAERAGTPPAHTGGARLGAGPKQQGTGGSRHSAAAPCGTTWAQPGGPGTTVTVDYGNCMSVPTLIAPLAIGDGPDARYSYTGIAQYVPPGGQAAQFRIDAPLFPPEPTNLQWTTRVM